jgi:hypothetical protein
MLGGKLSQATIRSMHIIAWQFEVLPNRKEEFEAGYSPNGAWATFFRLSPDFLGTKLFKDNAVQNCYLTLDFWTSRNAYDRFRIEHEDEYKRLDNKFEPLTIKEEFIGTMEQS